jgi:hypothetical protein
MSQPFINLPNVIGMEEATDGLSAMEIAVIIEEFWDAYFVESNKLLVEEVNAFSNPLLGLNISTFYLLKAERYWFEVFSIRNASHALMELVKRVTRGQAPELDAIEKAGVYSVG